MSALACIPDATDVCMDEVRGLVATPPQILTWLQAAKPGDRFVYATRNWLPANSQGASYMRTLEMQGLVYLARKRSDLLLGEFNYFAERSTRAIADARGPAADRAKLTAHTRRPPNDDVAAINALMPILERAARFGRPCPTDVVLAERAGIARAMVQPTLDAMRAANMIRVAPCSAPTLRLVTIVGTGHRTGIMA